MKILILCLLFLVSSQDQIPEYLAIQTQYPGVKLQILSFVIHHMDLLRYAFPDDIILQKDSQLLTQIILNQTNEWILAQPWHVTCLYIGKNYTQMETPFYTTFIENKEVPINVSSFVYVPSKIMIGAALLNRTEVLIQNDCPHVTLLRDEWPAVNSNYVLEKLFENGGPLESMYPELILEDNKFTIIEKYENLLIDGEYVTVYISKAPQLKDLNLKGITKKMFE